MAENKKSFILYCDLINTVRKMPKDKAGELFMTILSYVNDENPVVDDLLVDVVFEPVKLQLKRDLEKWDKFKEKQSENGKKGGRPTKEEREEKPNNPTLNLESQKSLNATATVNETVTEILVVVSGEEKKLSYVTDIFEADVGLKMNFSQKGMPPGEFSQAVEAWMIQNHQKKYGNFEDLRKHFLFWMPNYGRNKEEKNGTVKKSNTSGAGRKRREDGSDELLAKAKQRFNELRTGSDPT